jgi:hypothetical protein
VPWFDIVNFLKDKFKSSSRELIEDGFFKQQHLIIFNPYNSDYLIQFILWKVDEHGLPESSQSLEDISPSTETVKPKARRSTISLGHRQQSVVLPVLNRLSQLQNLGVRLAQVRFFGIFAS